MELTYEEMLARMRKGLKTTSTSSKVSRLELPTPQIMWIGRKTIFRNFADFPKVLRRDPNKVLMHLAKALATAASLDGERAIFIGRKDKASFSVLLSRYMKESVICTACGSPDTKTGREKRLQFLICEACGAKTALKGSV